MRKKGWRACCVPAAHVIHHAGQSSKQIGSASFASLWISRARLYAQHHGPFKRWLAKALVSAQMRRRRRGASPEMDAACARILEAWGKVR
jgi:GT2 family glycosyltransferase